MQLKRLRLNREEPEVLRRDVDGLDLEEGGRLARQVRKGVDVPLRADRPLVVGDEAGVVPPPNDCQEEAAYEALPRLVRGQRQERGFDESLAKRDTGKVRPTIIRDDQPARQHEPHQAREDELGGALYLPHHQGENANSPDCVADLVFVQSGSQGQHEAHEGRHICREGDQAVVPNGLLHKEGDGLGEPLCSTVREAQLDEDPAVDMGHRNNEHGPLKRPEQRHLSLLGRFVPDIDQLAE
mmetsp:Transcript_53759/g.155095  ORF Transcript_53759/g.155095 Transcript_53759/m.155095 type:complete len:240 (-) Transcript_53759:414-1133(-)